MSDQLIQDSQAKIEAMEAKILALETQLKEHVDYVKAKAHADAQEVDMDLKKDAERLYHDLSPLVEKYKEDREEIIRKASYKVCEHPGLAMALAFGAGLLFAKVLEDKVERCEHLHHHI